MPDIQTIQTDVRPTQGEILSIDFQETRKIRSHTKIERSKNCLYIFSEKFLGIEYQGNYASPHPWD